jgi:REP element-mobilizing transposase RayT
MTRIARNHVKGGIFYLVARGDGDQEIFLQSNHFETYLELIKKYRSKHSFILYAYCLLPKQVHLVLEPRAGAAVSEIMHDLNANYTRFFNASKHRKGHLFQERFRVCLLEKELYLEKITAFVQSLPSLFGKSESSENYRLSEAPNTSAATFSREELVNLWKQMEAEPVLGSPQFVSLSRSAVRKAGQKKGPVKLFLAAVVIGALFIGGLLSLSFYQQSKSGLRQRFAAKEAEMNRKVLSETHQIYQDLDEKYRADKVSYQAMAMRLKVEQKKYIELQGKIND